MKNFIPELNKFKSDKEYKDYIKALPKNIRKLDIHDDLLAENYLVNNPDAYFAPNHIKTQKVSNYISKLKKNTKGFDLGVWVFMPWLNTLVHTIGQNDYMLLRTVRNRNLINQDDQKILYDKSVAVIGLSVGLNILLALARFGIGNRYIIADADTVAVSNFNRSVYSLQNLNLYKSDVAVESLSMIDPFLQIKSFNEGMQDEHIEQIVRSSALIIDTFDTFDLKIRLRKVARFLKVPVISCFDIDKGVLLIVERYDLDHDLDLTLFLNGHKENEFYRKDINVRQKTEFFINIIGRQFHSKEMLQNVYDVGNKLTGYPQLAIATHFASALITYVSHQILLGKDIKSVRKYYSIPELLKQ